MPRRTWLLAAGGAVLFVVALWGIWLLIQSFSATERTLGELRTLPLVGLLVDDVPGAEDRLRKAIEDEQRQPTTEGPSRPLLVITDLRREHIAPAVRAADDASVTAVMAARTELVRHLLRANPAACREFSMGGIQRVDLLDAEGQRLFRAVLTALEKAYRSGRAHKGAPPAVASRLQINDLLSEAGFAKPDFDKLAAFATLSNEVSCEIELKVNEAAWACRPTSAGRSPASSWPTEAGAVWQRTGMSCR